MNKFFAFCALGYGLSAIAQAEITDHGAYTHDSATGLYWLDVTLTQNLSYNEVIQRLQPGAPLEGWRYADHTELEVLIQNFGIPPQGNSCNRSALYCDDISAEYAEPLEDLIRLLGDTEAAYDNLNPFSKSVPPWGAGLTRGIIHGCGNRGVGWIEDGEYYNQRSGVPTTDAVDEIRSVYCTSPNNLTYYGSFLVRDSEPDLPIVVDLNPLPLPNLPAGGSLLFNNLAPEDLGLNIECEFPWADGPCSYSANGFSAYTTDSLYPETGSFSLWLSDNFDAQEQPWMRITGFDFSNPNDGGGCTMSNPIQHAGTRESATDLSLYEGGNNLCRIELTDVDYTFLPPIAAWPDEHIRIISGTYIDYRSQSGGPYWGYSIDNVVVEFMPANMTIEFDPWRNNEIQPTEAYFAIVDILTTSIASGDSFDFDASQVDTATLVLGPGQAPNVAAPQSTDLDGDGDLDLSVGFRVENSGLGCLDTEVTVTGRTLAGAPLFGRASVTPVNCAKTISIDVDPFNVANEVRPDDSYVILVGVKSTSTAAGDATDVDALQIDPASLRFGPAGATSAAAPISADLDGDTDTDVIFGFEVADSGLLCGDTEVVLEGEQYNGYPVTGTDAITTVDCVEASCHP